MAHSTGDNLSFTHHSPTDNLLCAKADILNDDQYFPHTKGEISVSETLRLFKDVNIDIFFVCCLISQFQGDTMKSRFTNSSFANDRELKDSTTKDCPIYFMGTGTQCSW